jgi:hypothetical protein
MHVVIDVFQQSIVLILRENTNNLMCIFSSWSYFIPRTRVLNFNRLESKMTMSVSAAGILSSVRRNTSQHTNKKTCKCLNILYLSLFNDTLTNLFASLTG